MPYLGRETYYRIVGERKDNGKAPLILLHGGPGSTHNYFETLDKVADLDDRMLVMYDQIGCGNSYLDGHPELWTRETWMNELEELRKYLKLDTCHVLGQSWGGMMCFIYACDYKHEGVKSFIMSSTLPYNKIWEIEQKRRISYMDEESQKAIKEAEESGNYESDAYLKAVDKFMNRYCYDQEKIKQYDCLTRPKKSGGEAYVAGWGPNEFTPIGNLKDYDYKDKMKDIDTPCMIFDGAEDLCSPYIAKMMHDSIPNSEWHLFQYSKHMCFVDENEEYIKVLIDWLNRND